jgi:hypothetical protein
MLSERAKAILQNNGWDPARQRDISKVKSKLVGAGFPWFPAVEQIFTEFLDLSFPYPYDCSPYCQAASFEIVAFLFTASDLEAYTNAISKQLCPIGDCEDTMFVMLTDSDGMIYMMDDCGEFARIGDSIYDAIEGLLSGREPLWIRIPIS